MRPKLLGERAFDGLRRSMSEYARLAYVEDVDVEKGSATIRWLDHPGTRTNVNLSHSGPGSWEWPVKGQAVLVAQSKGDIPHIVRYLPIGYAARVKAGVARALSPGEKLWESFRGSDDQGVPSPTGTEIYMNNRGDVMIATATGDYWKISRDDNKIFQNSAVWEVTTEGGRLVFGVIKRIVDKKTKIVTKNNIPLLFGGQSLTEFKLQVVNESDTGSSVGIDDPLVEVTLGTAIDADGNPTLTDEGKKTYIDISTKSSVGFRLSVDHDGKMTMTAKKMTFLSDTIEVGKNTTRKDAARAGDKTGHIDPYSGLPVWGRVDDGMPMPLAGSATSTQVKISN